MDKVENPYLAVLERVHLLDRSIHVLTLVNNDLRHILHKHKPLPQFVQDSFKRAPISRSKTSPALPPPKPVESEEVRLAANILDKAKRTIENIGEKKPKQAPAVIPTVTTSIQSAPTQISRSKSSSSVRPTSSNSTGPSLSDSSTSQPPPPPPTVRRFMPAHMKAPFLTQPEKKRRPGSSARSTVQTNSNPKTSTAHRSLSQQRRQSQSSFSINQSIVELPPQSTKPAAVLAIAVFQQDSDLMADDETNNVIHDETSHHPSSESPEMDASAIPPEPIILNRALVKPLRRVWKQNQNLRLRLQRELDKKPLPSPNFINRLNEQIHSTSDADEMHVPTVEVLLLLGTKLRAIILHLLETSTFDDLESALKRLHTLKYLVNQYQFFSGDNLNVLVAKQLNRAKPIRINNEDWLNTSKTLVPKKSTVRYTDDSQLIAFTEVRFQQLETECRWLELSWHEQMIHRFKQTLASKDQNPLQLYRELMSLITGLQTSTPIVVENRN